MNHQLVLELLGICSLLSFVGSLVAVPWLIGRLPEDYFIGTAKKRESQRVLHPLRAFCILVLRNSLGLLFLLAGFAMLFLPGQGLITMIIGLSLLDFPGKREVMLLVVKYASVQKGLNWIRRKQGKELFLFVATVDRGR